MSSSTSSQGLHCCEHGKDTVEAKLHSQRGNPKAGREQEQGLWAGRVIHYCSRRQGEEEIIDAG